MSGVLRVHDAQVVLGPFARYPSLSRYQVVAETTESINSLADIRADVSLLQPPDRFLESPVRRRHHRRDAAIAFGSAGDGKVVTIDADMDGGPRLSRQMDMDFPYLVRKSLLPWPCMEEATGDAAQMAVCAKELSTATG